MLGLLSFKLHFITSIKTLKRIKSSLSELEYLNAIKLVVYHT